MKKIIIDLYKSKNAYSGLGQFSIQFANYLSEHYAHEFEFHFLVPRDNDLTFSPLIKIKKVNPLLRIWKSSHEQYDLWHSLYQFAAHKPPSTFNQLLTIHDLNFLFEKTESKREKYLNRLKKEIERANHVTAISEFTKSQIQSSIPQSDKMVDVIYNGLEYLPDLDPTRPSYINGHKFFFTISLFSSKKNFEVLVSMMNHFPNTKLIIAGDHDTSYGEFIKKEISKLGLENQVVLPGKIPNSEKVYLYKFCEAFLFSSIAEGFGFPPIEAMQFGKPVFLSRFTSLPEVGGDAAYYFDSFEPESMANTIKQGLNDFQSNIYEREIEIKRQASKFTWKKSMEKYVSLYRKLTT